jgi:DNA primase
MQCEDACAARTSALSWRSPALVTMATPLAWSTVRASKTAKPRRSGMHRRLQLAAAIPERAPFVLGNYS